MGEGRSTNIFFFVFQGQGRAGQGRAGQGRAGQGRAGQGSAAQRSAAQGRAGQGRAGQGRAGRPQAQDAPGRELCLDGGGLGQSFYSAHRIPARAQLPSRSRGLRFAQGPTRLRSLLRARCAPCVLRCGSAIVSLEAPRLSLGFRV